MTGAIVMNRKLLVPDHYPDFHCKCGECRTPCCSGWGISMSMKDYFRVLGMDCSRELRERLDTAVSVLGDFTEERYAALDPDWTGHCKLQRKDNGYCMLQCECGEEAIPEVCRRYPRVYRCGKVNEAALSNSCEHTLELLFSGTEPVTLVEIPAPDSFSEVEKQSLLQYDGEADPALSEECRAARLRAMAVLSDREKPFCERLKEAVCPDAGAIPDRTKTDAVNAVLELLSVLAADSPSLGEETAEILGMFGRGSAEGLTEADVPAESLLAARYAALEEAFSVKHPGSEYRFEKMMVNHLYFGGFPYSARKKSTDDEYIALIAVYAFMRFVNVCLPDRNPVDLNAAVFRLIEHSSFTWNAPIVLRQCGIRTPADALCMARYL